MSDFICEVGEPFIRLADFLIELWLCIYYPVADWFSGRSERTQHVILGAVAILCIVALGLVEGSEI